jgi:hypothetical protein
MGHTDRLIVRELADLISDDKIVKRAGRRKPTEGSFLGLSRGVTSFQSSLKPTWSLIMCMVRDIV